MTPKADISWQPTTDMNFYVSVGKGYRVGGVNPQINNTQPACQTALAADDLQGKLSRTYSPDSLWSYEIGTKDQLFENHLEVQASIYHILWNNIQQVAGIQNCGFAAVFNLGSATSNGFDLSVRTAVLDDLHMGLQIAYTDAHYNSSQGNIVAAGDVIGGPSASSGEAVPPWTLTATTEYTLPLFGKKAYFWVEDVYHSMNNGPFASHNPVNIVDYDPSLVPDPATNVVNFRTGLRFDRFDVPLFMNNVLDTHPQLSYEHTSAGDSRYQAVTLRPRTGGLTATYRF